MLEKNSKSPGTSRKEREENEAIKSAFIEL
jgi:hypothetical protein